MHDPHDPQHLFHDATPATRREAHRAKMAEKKAARRASVARANARHAQAAAQRKALDLSSQAIAEGERQDRKETARETMHAIVGLAGTGLAAALIAAGRLPRGR